MSFHLWARRNSGLRAGGEQQRDSDRRRRRSGRAGLAALSAGAGLVPLAVSASHAAAATTSYGIYVGNSGPNAGTAQGIPTYDLTNGVVVPPFPTAGVPVALSDAGAGPTMWVGLNAAAGDQIEAVSLPGLAAGTPLTLPIGTAGAANVSHVYEAPDSSRVYVSDGKGGVVSVAPTSTPSVNPGGTNGVLNATDSFIGFTGAAASGSAVSTVYAVTSVSNPNPNPRVLVSTASAGPFTQLTGLSSNLVPSAIALAPAQNLVYVLGTYSGTPSLVPVALSNDVARSPVTLTGVSGTPLAMALSSDGKTAYITTDTAGSTTDTLYQVALTLTTTALGTTETAVASTSWTVGKTARDVLLNGSTLYTANQGSSTLSKVVIGSSGVTTVSLPDHPTALALGPDIPPITGVSVVLNTSSASAPAGIRSIGLDGNAQLPASAIESSSSLTGAGNVASLPLGSLNLGAKAVSGPSAAPLGSLPLGSLSLGSTALSSIPGAVQALEQVLLSNLPVAYPAGCSGTACTGWAGLLSLSSSLAGRPVQSVTLAQVLADPSTSSVVQSLPLGSLDLTASPLGSLSLEALALATMPLGSIPLSSSDTTQTATLQDWCTKLAGLGFTCASLGIDPTNPSADANVTPLSLSLAGVPLGSLPLGSLPLGSLTLDGTPLGSLPLGSLALSSIPLGSLPLGSLPLGSLPLGSLPLGSLPLGSLPLGSLPLGSLPLGSLPLGSLPLGSLPLGSLALSSITNVSTLVDCTKVNCSSGTLAQALQAGAIFAGSTLFGLAQQTAASNLSGTTLGQLGSYNGTTLAQLAAASGTSSAFSATTLGQLGSYNGTTITQLGTYGSTTLASLGFYGLGPLTSTSVLTLPLGSLPLGSLPLGSLPLGSLPLGSLPLGSLPLGSLPLSSITNVSTFVDCSKVNCSTSTLSQAAVVGALYLTPTLAQLRAATSDSHLTNTTLAQLGSYNGTTLSQLGAVTTDSRFTGTTLAQLGTYGATTAGQVDSSSSDLLSQLQQYEQVLLSALIDAIVSSNPTLLNGMYLGDLLRGIIPEGQYPWQSVDLSNPALPAASADGGRLTLTAAVTLQGGGGKTTLTFTVPSGFRYMAGSALLNGTTALPDPTRNGQTYTLTVTLPVGSSNVSIVVAPGEVLGSVPLSVTAAASTFTSTSSTSVTVTDPWEPNASASQAQTLGGNTLNASFLTGPSDLDYWAVNVPNGDALALSLSNLDKVNQDYDMVLYGPPTAPLRGAPQQDLASVTEPVPYQTSASGQQDPPNTSDIPISSTNPVVAVSAHRGALDESIATPPLPGGTYIVQISGYNGAFSTTQPYLLRSLLLTTPASPTCAAPTYPNAPGSPGTLPSSYPANVDTLFLVDTQRLTAAYGATAASQIESAAAAVAASGAGGMVGAVVPVDGDTATRNAYGAWDASPCSVPAANAVVSAIGSLVDGIRAAHPTVRNLVLVGADDQIPMARIPDGTVVENERDYAASTLPGLSDQLSAALAQGNFLSDDPYASPVPLGVGGQALYTPQLSVGRLVESPSQIVGALQRYQSSGGVLSSTTGLSTGYDFLTSGAQAIAADLSSVRPGQVAQLINDNWTAAQLNSALTTATPPQVVGLDGHFDFSRMLSAAGNTSGSQDDILHTSDLRNDGASAFTGRLLFSMGCHSGLDIPLNEVSNAVPGGVDSWATTFADEGALWVANTGYGYADTDSIAYSARLMDDFAHNLDGHLTVGAAFAQAKQRYAADTTVLDAYDLKSSMESVLYGMPNYHLNVGPPPVGPAPVPPATGVDPITGLVVAPVSVSVPLGTSPGQQSSVTAPAGGTFYQVNQSNGIGETQATAGFPIEPLTTLEVTQPAASGGGLADLAHGALITGLTSQDTASFTPAFAPAQTDLAAHEPPTVQGETAFPNAMQRVASYQTFDGAGQASVQHQQLDLVTGQFLPDPAHPGTGTQRLFTSVQAQVLYTAPGDTSFTPPTLSSIQGYVASVANGATADFSVNATAAAGSTVKEVLVLFTDAGAPGHWTPVRLLQLADGSWTGGATAPASKHIAFIVEAVDNHGNVAVSSHKAVDWHEIPLSQSNGGLAISASGPNPIGGYFTGTTQVTITVPAGQSATYTVGAGAPQTITQTTTFSVSGDGTHVVKAFDSAGDQAALAVLIDTTAPTVSSLVTSSHVSPDGTWAGPGAQLLLSAADAGSGVASLTYSTGSGSPAPVTGPLPVPSGTTTWTITAVDNVGNSATTTVTTKVDSAPPTVNCPAADGSWHRTDVSVTCSASDSQSGLANPSQSSVTLSTSVPAGTATSNASTNSVAVCDQVSNCATAGPVTGFKVDKAPPTVTISTPAPGAAYTLNQPATASYSCADVGSGVASCTAKVGTTSVSNGGAIPTSAVGVDTLTVTATDVAGNTTVQSVTYDVTYGICNFTPPIGPVGSLLVFNVTLCDYSGKNVSSSSITISAVDVDGTTPESGSFTYVPLTNSYSFVLNTTGFGAGNHVLDVAVTGDPLHHALAFTLT